MREIKFRAWNKERQKILDVFDINFRTPATVQILDENYVLYDELFDCVELMQFTGMQDKNGVQIYEGDVVSDHVGIGVVEYSEKRSSFRVNYRDGFCKWFIDYNLKGELESIEVIGNIHQHAHLLEQNKC